MEQTARFCGMHWEDPIILKGAHRVPEAALDAAAALYRTRVAELIARGGNGS